MTNKGYKKLSQLLSTHIKHPIEGDFIEPTFHPDQKEKFWDNLVRYADGINLAIIKNQGTITSLSQHLEKSITPFIAECNMEDTILPIIFYVDKSGKTKATIIDVLGQETDINVSVALEHLVRIETGEIIYAIPVSNNPLISDESTKAKSTSISRLYRLLSAEKKDISYIYIYALLISLFGLV